MATRRADSSSDRPRRRPARTTEARENQLIAKAMDEAERQIDAGTATSQLLTHFLKLGSTREDLEKERLRNENSLLKAKVESLASAQHTEELYEKALRSMRIYSGRPEDGDEDPNLRRAPADQIVRRTI